MTSLPAEHFGLAGRGRIARGMSADIVVFDQATVRDRADYAMPHAYSDGIRHVIVNGVHTISNGNLTGRRGGRML
jgi:N-acyl-D-amino-acid deacylase